MGRCEGYYRLENRRCDRATSAQVRAMDGERYGVCEYHRRQGAAANVARWHGDGDLRRSPAVEVRPPELRHALA